MRILVAEDESVSREVLSTCLNKWGHDVVVCVDGTGAWRVLQGEDPPKFLLIDWMMPGMNGLELCHRVRERASLPSTYIILVTVKDKKKDIVEGLQAGADDYIVKPFDGDELKARIQVGVRVPTLWEQLLEAERTRVLAQTAGAAAHEINQPLSVLLGLSQILRADEHLDAEKKEMLELIEEAVGNISGIVRKMSTVQQYVTKSYLKGMDIVDFDATSLDQ